MKNLLTACLPALALFALGGCAGTSALTSSEDDGVYYSSRDRTTAVVSTAPTQYQSSPSTATNPDEAVNPDYNGGSTNSSANQNSGSTQYYDNTYSYMQGVPASPGLNYYSPYSPYTSLSYGASAYSWGGGYCGYSPYGSGFYDPFYSSFYSPYYGYRSGLSISFGFGRPYGYGGYGGYGYGSPYGYGYGSPYGSGYGGLYDPYYYGGSYYGGYYGRGGYYGSSYYGGNYGYSNGYYGNDNRSNRASSHRTDRASDGRYSTGGGVVNSPGTTTGTPSGGRGRTTDGLMAPGQQPQTTSAGVYEGRRTRSEAVTGSPATMSDQTAGTFNQPQNIDRPRRSTDAAPAGQPAMDASQGQLTRGDSRNRGFNNAEAMPQGNAAQPTAAPQPERRQRGFFQNVFTQPANTGGSEQTADQSRQRAYSQPQQQQSYDQPRQRSEQPQRSYSQPSYSAPSYGGGGGGNGGGGGGGGGRGRSH